jgi:hypothetical protein
MNETKQPNRAGGAAPTAAGTLILDLSEREPDR